MKRMSNLLSFLLQRVHLLALKEVLTISFLLLSCPSVHSLSVCHRGFFNCSYSPCPAVCTAYSDRHYHTFDGLEYDYYSDCQVYLLKVSLNVHIYFGIVKGYAYILKIFLSKSKKATSDRLPKTNSQEFLD